MPFPSRSPSARDGVSVVVDPPEVLVALRGEIDVSFDRALRRAGDEVRLSRTPRHVVVDLHDLSFIDSTGLAFVARLVRDGGRGDRLELLDPTVHVEHVLRMVGFGGLIALPAPPEA